MKKLLAIAITIICVTFGFIVYAAGSGAGTGDQEQGLFVKNREGEDIGTSTHVLVDLSTGNIAFIVISLSEEGHKEILAPLDAFSIDLNKGVLLLNVSKKDLAAAPEYDASTQIDRNFVEKVYHFFGVAPPWVYEAPKVEL